MIIDLRDNPGGLHLGCGTNVATLHSEPDHANEIWPSCDTSDERDGSCDDSTRESLALGQIRLPALPLAANPTPLICPSRLLNDATI